VLLGAAVLVSEPAPLPAGGDAPVRDPALLVAEGLPAAPPGAGVVPSDR
jgi:hypothetical protein